MYIFVLIALAAIGYLLGGLQGWAIALLIGLFPVFFVIVWHIFTFIHIAWRVRKYM